MMQSKSNTRRKSHLRLVTPPAQNPVEKAMASYTAQPLAVRRGGDIFTALNATDDLYESLGIYERDTAILFHTGDVGANDIGVIETEDGTWLGTYRPAPGGYITFECDGETTRYRPGTARLVGRIIHVERRGKIFKRFRPIR